MKNLIILLLLFACAVNGFSQSPQGINYQAVIRNSSGSPLVSQNVGIKFTIRNSSSTAVYSETHTITTNAFGLVNLVIGQGTTVSGVFNTIDWGSGVYNIELAVDNTGGVNYVSMGTPQPFMSVPYALYALKSGSGGSTGGTDTPYTAGTGITVTNRVISNIGDLSNTNEIQTLSTSGNNITLSNGGGTVAMPTEVYRINSSNLASYTANTERMIIIEGTITLTANSNIFCSDDNYIYGGIIAGSGYDLCVSDNIINGTTFNNMSLSGTNGATFIGCKFNNVTALPFDCVLINCTLTNCTLGSSNRIFSMTNSKISGSNILRLLSITNSFIYSSSSIGSASYHTARMSNCNVDASNIYLSGTFTGNTLYDSKLWLYPSWFTVTCTGNAFETSSIGNFLEVDFNNVSPVSINITGNSFKGSTTYPNNQHIKLVGNFTGTRYICKIANNTFVGGTGPCVSNSVTGNASIMVNDNDLLYTGGLGVSTGGFVYVRNNQAH